MLFRVRRSLELNANESRLHITHITDEQFPSHVYSAELVLEMLEATISQGASLPRALELVGSVMCTCEGKALQTIGQQLSQGQNWDRVWKGYVQEPYSVVGVVHNVLEPVYKRGTSASLRIENAIEDLKNRSNQSINNAAHELAVRILIPLGLCFLPGFIILTVVPLIASLLGFSG
ncbi:type II secretion system F family protein [Alloscardovia theropitheci]|nr:type II secretion system F family protein [Alloscardovia theropitheci]